MKPLASHSVAVVAGCAIGTTVYHIFLTRSSEKEIERSTHDPIISTQDSSTRIKLRHASPASPTIPMVLLHPNPNFEIAFDTRTRNPIYVLETLSGNNKAVKDQVEKTSIIKRENKRFFEETSSLPPFHRSRNGHFRNSGYDRGHMAPSADFNHDESLMNDTFSLCNVSPQVPSFNRIVWSRLERLVRRVAAAEGENTITYVVTGPLWIPTDTVESNEGFKNNYKFSHLAIGSPPNLVHVPTHFFKVIAIVKQNEKKGKSDIIKFAAFVLPNQKGGKEDNKIPLSQYAVRLTDLETVSGMQFFPGLWQHDSQGEDMMDLKEWVDAITEDIWMGSSSQRNKSEMIGSGNSGVSSASTVNINGVSKRRKQKVRKILKNKAFPFMKHICEDGGCEDSSYKK